MKDDERGERMKENLIAIAVVVVVIGLFWWWVEAARAPSPQQDVRVPLPVGTSPVLGAEDAPVTVVQFSDFECPYCAAFATQSFSDIKERFIDTGQARFVYKHFPLTQIHGHALLAAEAAACAHDQGAFWRYHDLLYEHQTALEVNQLLGYGEEIDLDMDRFRPCVINEERRNEVLADKDAGIQAGVTGTPTFFFNGRMVVGALSPAAFEEEILREAQ